jgi:hypothetical protein
VSGALDRGFDPTLYSHFTFFHAVYHGKIPEVLKTAGAQACIYPALIREIFSRLGPLSSGVIMCMYGNFTVRLVTVWIARAKAGRLPRVSHSLVACLLIFAKIFVIFAKMHSRKPRRNVTWIAGSKTGRLPHVSQSLVARLLIFAKLFVLFV